MKFEEIKSLAQEVGLEATLWEKNGLRRIYFNYHTGSGYAKTVGCFIIETDGTIEVDKSGKYTTEVKKIWNTIPVDAKLTVEE